MSEHLLTMETLQTKLNEIIGKMRTICGDASIDNATKMSKMEDLGASIGDSLEILEDSGFPFLGLMDRMQKSNLNNQEEIEEIYNEVSKISQLEKNLTLLMIELVYLQGSTENSSDLELRRFWFNKLKQLTTN